MSKKLNLNEVLANNSAQAIEIAKEALASKSSTTTTAAKKDSPKLKPVAPKNTKKKEVTQEVATQQNVSIVEEVISAREVKYIYPEDVTDTLARKKWRQQTRNKLHQLEREMYRITDQNSKEYKAAKKAYEAFKATVLKPAQTA